MASSRPQPDDPPTSRHTASITPRHTASLASAIEESGRSIGFLKTLEEENRKLKKLLAEQVMDNATLKEMLGKNF